MAERKFKVKISGNINKEKSNRLRLWAAAAKQHKDEKSGKTPRFPLPSDGKS